MPKQEQDISSLLTQLEARELPVQSLVTDDISPEKARLLQEVAALCNQAKLGPFSVKYGKLRENPSITRTVVRGPNVTFLLTTTDRLIGSEIDYARGAKGRQITVADLCVPGEYLDNFIRVARYTVRNQPKPF